MYSSMLSRRVKLIPSVSANQIGYVGLAVPTLELGLGLQALSCALWDLEEDER